MEYLEFSSVVNYRVPVKEDGTLGTPEITNKWTTAPKKTKKFNKKKPVVKEAVAEDSGQVTL